MTDQKQHQQPVLEDENENKELSLSSTSINIADDEVILQDSQYPLEGLDQANEPLTPQDLAKRDLAKRLNKSVSPVGNSGVKASYIGHLCAVRTRATDYQRRLKQFNLDRSTRGHIINTRHLSNRIYDQVYKVRTSLSMPRDNSSVLQSADRVSHLSNKIDPDNSTLRMITQQILAEEDIAKLEGSGNNTTGNTSTTTA